MQVLISKETSYCELMYKKNFYDKYDETTYKRSI